MSPEPKPPKLPEDTATRTVPREIREFVDCRGSALTLEPGPVDWLDLPGGLQPTARFDHGPTPGSIEVTITLSTGLGDIELKLPCSVRDGRLEVDTNQVPGEIPGLGNPRQAIDGWVRAFNDWLAHNHKQLGEVRLRGGRLTLTKVAEVGWSTGRKVGAGVAVVAALVMLALVFVLLAGGGPPAAQEAAVGEEAAGPAADQLALTDWVGRADPICADSEGRVAALAAPTDLASYAAWLAAFRAIFDAEVDQIEALGLPVEGADDIERILDGWQRQRALAGELQAAAERGDGPAFQRTFEEIQAINAELDPVARRLGLSTCAVENTT
jgi:hypothetical protein